MVRFVSWNRWFGRGAVIAALALLCTGLVGAANTSNPSTIYACVTNVNGDNANGDRNDHGDAQSGTRGAIRIIAAGDTCHKNETLVNWNTQGIQGVPGPVGPAGAPGPQGPQGPAGAPAPTIRGIVNPDGTIDPGQTGGYTIHHDGPGQYTINFTLPGPTFPLIVTQSWYAQRRTFTIEASWYNGQTGIGNFQIISSDSKDGRFSFIITE